jgi:CRP-like cAMP-binding protein
MNVQEMWYLEGIDLFGRLCPLKSKESEAITQPRLYGMGELIYIPGDAADFMHVVVMGRVRIGRHLDDGREVTKAILGEGEVFGEMALAGEPVRKEFAESMDNGTQVCLISITEVKALMLSEADMSIRIIKWMGLRIMRLERKIELLTFKDVRTRIIEFLKDAAAYKGKPVGSEVMIKTKLTHSDIAKLTGTSRQTVSEILNQMRSEDQIYFERGKILIRDVQSLK